MKHITIFLTMQLLLAQFCFADTTTAPLVHDNLPSIYEKEYWKQKEELAKDREEKSNEVYNKAISTFSWVTWVVGIFFFSFTILGTLYGFFISRKDALLKEKQDKIDEQQKKLNEQQQKLEAKQEEMDKTLKRMHNTEDWAIQLRNKAKVVIVCKNSTNGIHVSHQVVFNSEFGEVPIQAIDKLSEFNFYAFSFVVLINNKVSDKPEAFDYSKEETVAFAKRVGKNRNTALMVLSDLQFTREVSIDENPLLSATTQPAQLYQNLMNLLKYQDILIHPINKNRKS